MRKLALLLMMSSLAACGQRGALYLPGESKEPVTQPEGAVNAGAPAATPTPSAEDAAERERRERARAN